MDVYIKYYKAFSSNDVHYYFTVLTFDSFLTSEKTTTNITAYLKLQ